jgi:hypothetical protein
MAVCYEGINVINVKSKQFLERTSRLLMTWSKKGRQLSDTLEPKYLQEIAGLSRQYPKFSHRYLKLKVGTNAAMYS